MTGLWSLESSAQLFTQNLQIQHTQPKRAHRGNKVGSGADDMPTLWLQCVSVWECSLWMHRVFCMRCLHWPNQADLLFVQSLNMFCSCAVSYAPSAYCKIWCTYVLWSFMLSNCELTSGINCSMHANTCSDPQKQTCTFVLHSLLRHIKLLQCSHDINLLLCRLLSVSQHAIEYRKYILTIEASLTLNISFFRVAKTGKKKKKERKCLLNSVA